MYHHTNPCLIILAVQALEQICISPHQPVPGHVTCSSDLLSKRYKDVKVFVSMVMDNSIQCMTPDGTNIGC